MLTTAAAVAREEVAAGLCAFAEIATVPPGVGGWDGGMYKTACPLAVCAVVAQTALTAGVVEVAAMAGMT
jgi:hypothetical protein